MVNIACCKKAEFISGVQIQFLYFVLDVSESLKL